MSYDYSLLEAKIREKFFTKERFANALGIGRTALYAKLQGTSQFKQDEIYLMVKLLGIKKNEVTIYFFTQKIRETEL